MKFQLLAVLLAVSSPVLAEEATEATQPGPDDHPMTSLTLNVGSLAVVNRATIEFERALTDVTVGYVGAGVLIAPVKRLYDGALAGEWGGELEVGFRFFPFHRAPTGLFIGPFANVAWTFADDTPFVHQGYSYAAGAMVGYTFFFGSFDLSLGVGGEYHHEHRQGGHGGIDTPDKGTLPLMPTGRLALGYAF